MNRKIKKTCATILSSLLVLCTSGVNAMIDNEEKKTLEICFLANVAKHLKSKDDIKNFMLVSKKCGDAVSSRQINDIPIKYEDAKKFYPNLKTFNTFGNISLDDMNKIALDGKTLYESKITGKIRVALLAEVLKSERVSISDINRAGNGRFEIKYVIPSNRMNTSLHCVSSVILSDSNIYEFGRIIELLYQKAPELAERAGLKKLFDLNDIENIFGGNKTILEEKDFDDCFAIGFSWFFISERHPINRVQSVVIPKSVIVGKCAFCMVGGLSNVIVKDNVCLCSGSFSSCPNLQNVVIGNHCTIDKMAFKDCTSLQTVTIGVGCEIEAGAFTGCTGLQNLVIGDKKFTKNEIDMLTRFSN